MTSLPVLTTVTTEYSQAGTQSPSALEMYSIMNLKK